LLVFFRYSFLVVIL